MGRLVAIIGIVLVVTFAVRGVMHEIGEKRKADVMCARYQAIAGRFLGIPRKQVRPRLAHRPRWRAGLFSDCTLWYDSKMPYDEGRSVFVTTRGGGMVWQYADFSPSACAGDRPRLGVDQGLRIAKSFARRKWAVEEVTAGRLLTSGRGDMSESATYHLKAPGFQYMDITVCLGNGVVVGGEVQPED